MSAQSLRQALQKLDRLIDLQMELVLKEAERKGMQANEMQNPDGSYILIPLLAAKAQVLSALAILEKK